MMVSISWNFWGSVGPSGKCTIDFQAHWLSKKGLVTTLLKVPARTVKPYIVLNIPASKRFYVDVTSKVDNSDFH